jgi:hypothetical protein
LKCFILYRSEARNLHAATYDALILEQSRLNNAAIGITGCLLRAENLYFQWIEGSESAVQFLIGRIKADYRHKNLAVLTRGHAQGRIFGRWLMGLVDVTEQTHGRTLVGSLENQIDPFTIRDLMLRHVATSSEKSSLS